MTSRTTRNREQQRSLARSAGTRQSRTLNAITKGLDFTLSRIHQSVPEQMGEREDEGKMTKKFLTWTKLELMGWRRPGRRKKEGGSDAVNKTNIMLPQVELPVQQGG